MYDVVFALALQPDCPAHVISGSSDGARARAERQHRQIPGPRACAYRCDLASSDRGRARRNLRFSSCRRGGVDAVESPALAGLNYPGRARLRAARAQRVERPPLRSEAQASSSAVGPDRRPDRFVNAVSAGSTARLRLACDRSLY